MHMYVTSALQKTDMKAVSLQLALDILHRKEDRDLITGLKSRTNAGKLGIDHPPLEGGQGPHHRTQVQDQCW
jgi:hypothetical protein